jgi:hypothetical protein
MSKIENAWLVWVGSEHYPTFKDYAEEAKAQGVSKRLPGSGMGKALQSPGTVVFVAHDDGEKSECPDCIRKIPCPECRKRRIAIGELQEEIDAFKAQFSSEAAIEKSGYATRSLKIRQGKIDALEAEKEHCSVCKGEGKAMLGSGGDVIKLNGKKWDYRTYNYWLHQPGKWDPKNEVDGVKEKRICETCGGLGTVPDGKICGMFTPERIEYILAGDESEAAMAKVEDFTAISPKAVKREAKRRCGVRRPGGVYAVTDEGGKTSKLTKEAIKILVEQGKIEASACDVFGNFVVFGTPIDISGVKRFRGMMRWKMSAKAADQADMALDAREEDEED